MLVRTALVLAWSALVASQDSNPCQSFGIDFQDGGTYYQNSLSNTPFTFVETFEGCQNDTAQNILVDPSGNEYQCTDTPMMPANTSELSTCPMNKTQLTTGEWSLIIISNNGDAQPIAYQRDFSLTVGPQSTVTATPTVTANLTSTPIHNVTLWVTQTNYTTLPPQTYTTPSVTVTPTKTMSPKPVIVTSMKTLYTVSMTIPMVSVTKVIKTVTATCTVPFRQPFCDQFAHITPTLVHAAALQTPGAPSSGHPGVHSSVAPIPTVVSTGSGRGPTNGQVNPMGGSPNANMPTNGNMPKFGSTTSSTSNSQSAYGPFSGWSTSNNVNRFGGWKREAEKNRREAELKEFLARRHDNLAKRNLHKRAPDVATVTVTDSNTADWKTTTQTWVIPTQTLTVTSTTMITATVTPSPVPVITGKSIAAVVTSTMPASTQIVQKPTIAWSLTTKMQIYTMTLTTTITPSASLHACQNLGGWFWPHGW